jgi:hypothetical protein
VTTAGGVVTVAGGKVEDVLVGAKLMDGIGSSLDYTDLAFLEDSSVDIDIGTTSGTYDYHEEIQFPSSTSFNATLTTGLAKAQTDDYKDSVFLMAGRNSIAYYFEFDEDLSDGNYIANASTSDPIELIFMGRNMKITSADADSVTVEIAPEYFLQVGDTVEVEGKTVELLDVASTGSSVVVSVAGVRGTVSNSG